MNLYDMPELSLNQRMELEFWQDDENEEPLTKIPLEKQAIFFALQIKSYRAEINARKEEIISQEYKIGTLQRQIDWCEKMVKMSLPQGKKISDVRVVISWRKSETVEIDKEFDDWDNNADYCRYIPGRWEPDKAKIKAAIKETGEIPLGVRLESHNHLQIK
jgi:hypothetical protein